jgi:predicted 3-demethylubiquinone-9 3-methyltransferase (glyoxalase superfamily)
MQKITPFLWFNDNAEEAVKFYTSVFSREAGSRSAGKNSKIGKITRYDEAGAAASGRPAGSVMTAEFQIEGQEFVAINGGPHFKFSEAVSFVVNCKNQEEVDYYWEKLSADPKAEMCGWLKDKFGLSWQIVPTVVNEYLSDKDPKKSQRVMQAILQMKKIDIETLKKAYAGELENAIKE